MKSLPVILGMVLAVSLLFNVVAFVRLSEEPVPAAPVRVASASDHRPALPAAVEVPAAARTVQEPVPVLPAPAGTPNAAPAAGTITTPSIRNDPKVREVLQANEAFGAFWKDLDRVFKVRSKFDEQKYEQTVLGATSDFLELGEPKRTQFEETSRAAAMSIAAARREQDAAKKGLPPKDKANPTAAAAYEQQKDLIEARYDGQVKAAVDSLRPYLNASDARHQEFLGSAEKWLRNLAPRTQP